jgi:hypothetical protein
LTGQDVKGRSIYKAAWCDRERNYEVKAISIEGINIFHYLFYIGVINIVFRLIWKILPIMIAITLPITTLSIPVTILRVASKLLKVFGHYILVSLVVLLTINAIEYNRTTSSFILYSIVGAFAIYIRFVNNLYKTQKRFAMGYDYEAMESPAYDGLITIRAVLLFITALLVPIIAVNPLIQWIFGIIDWIYKLKVVGWLIAVGGVLYMLSIIWHGITITEFLLASLFRKIGRRRHGNRFQIMRRDVEEQNGVWEVIESTPRKYITNKSSDVFHLPSCFWARKIAKDNKIYFRTFQEALHSGKRPCKICMPDRWI